MLNSFLTLYDQMPRLCLEKSMPYYILNTGMLLNLRSFKRVREINISTMKPIVIQNIRAKLSYYYLIPMSFFLYVGITPCEEGCFMCCHTLFIFFCMDNLKQSLIEFRREFEFLL